MERVEGSFVAVGKWQLRDVVARAGAPPVWWLSWLGRSEAGGGHELHRFVGVRMSGPLSSCGVGLYGALTERGYASSSAIQHVRLLAHLNRWLDRQCLEAAELTPERVEEFLRLRR